MCMLEDALEQLQISPLSCELIRSKDGIAVYRIATQKEKMVLKVFEKPENRREIENYRLLGNLGIRTLPVKGCTEQVLMLPDMNFSKKFRMGNEVDLNDTQVARAIAKWYRQLHDEGKKYLKHHSVSMYDELDKITLENIRRIAAVTYSIDNELWRMIESQFDAVKKKMADLPRTLTYNDFYWDNLIVAKDRTEAFMFDYNLLGKGTAYGDVRNVTSSMSKIAAEAFCEVYDTSEVESEKIADDILSHLVTLCIACEREKFPIWAEKSKELLLSSELQQRFMKWMG